MEALDTNSIALFQHFLALHPEVLPIYQRHEPAFAVALVWLVREWHNLGGWPTIQAYFDSREGGFVVWNFRKLFGRAKEKPVPGPVI